MKWLATTETVNLKLLVPSGLTVAAAVGAAAGYAVALKILEKKYEERIQREIEEAKVYYQGLYSRPPLVVEKDDLTGEEIDPDDVESEALDHFRGLPANEQQQLIGDAVRAFQHYVPHDESDPRPDPNKPASVVVNIFESPTPPGEEVLEALLADRNPEEPYIITKQEFLDNDPDYEQRSFTWYEGDSTLVDDKEEFNPVQDLNLVVGEDNLLRFGYGSSDEHVLYVRNESVSPPFDLYITRSQGKYTQEVIGFDNDPGPHLKHSQRRFRHSDE